MMTQFYFFGVLSLKACRTKIDFLHTEKYEFEKTNLLIDSINISKVKPKYLYKAKSFL